MEGLEPPRGLPRQHLKLVRLPVPPHPPGWIVCPAERARLAGLAGRAPVAGYVEGHVEDAAETVEQAHGYLRADASFSCLQNSKPPS